jgi:DNA-binding transcriptional ArsR family regulator
MAVTLQRLKAQLFRALAHEVRVRVLEELRGGERTVGDLQDAIGVSGSSMSQHLAVLRAEGVVIARREGPNVLYSVADERLFRLLDDARAIFEQRISEGAALLRDRAEPDPGDVPQPPPRAPRGRTR